MAGFFKHYLRSRGAVVGYCAGCGGIFAVVFALYGLPLEAVLYPGALCLLLGAAVLGLDLLRQWSRHRQRVLVLHHMDPSRLPPPKTPAETELTTLAQQLFQQTQAQRTQDRTREQEALDYFAAWVHQIKTPIAAMRLLLREDPADHVRDLEAELFRVERYVELALSYLRLDGGGTDYLIREYALDAILRQAARKYAPLFIRSRVSLELEETGLQVLTDEKWLQLVVEQVLSNAVKYAPGGHVKVWCEGERLLVRDDGVGIAPEDLPRVFDRGFTGCNGRMDKRATGIGLYLSREICRRLGHTISLDSEPGKGTLVTIDLTRPELEVE